VFRVPNYPCGYLKRLNNHAQLLSGQLMFEPRFVHVGFWLGSRSGNHVMALYVWMFVWEFPLPLFCCFTNMIQTATRTLFQAVPPKAGGFCNPWLRTPGIMCLCMHSDKYRPRPDTRTYFTTFLLCVPADIWTSVRVFSTRVKVNLVLPLADTGHVMVL